MFNFRRERGITLIEIIVTICIIALFSLILIANFPKIQKQYSLSRATYKLAQDFRRMQDLGLSGIAIKDAKGKTIAATGYGIYVNISEPFTSYIVYADVKPDLDDPKVPGNGIYDGDLLSAPCSETNAKKLEDDCIIEVVDVSEENESLFIKFVTDGRSEYNGVSVTFIPPNPITKITTIPNISGLSEIGISLGLNGDSLAQKSVWVNSSGLINIR